jgi:hypothetical protein
MSDFMQYTQWRQREEALPRELEQARAIAELSVTRPRPASRQKMSVAARIVAAFGGGGSRRARRVSGNHGTMEL